MQCHPLGVVPKKHSSDWRTIYHISYLEGDSINDYIPKEPYALRYVRVDDAIRILLSLGLGSYMAKTDLKSAFCLIPIHPGDWHLMGIYWQSRISLVFWATELDMSLSSSICQPSSICQYRARGLSLFRGDKVKTVIELDDLSSSVTYRARWLTELGFSREEKKEKKWKLKQ